MYIDNTQIVKERRISFKSQIFLTQKRDRSSQDDSVDDKIGYKSVQNKVLNNVMASNTSEGSRLSCKCKNSQCLKLYCDCFSVGRFCDPKICSCQGCSNNTENKVILCFIFLINF